MKKGNQIERGIYINLLLETATYIATTETVTCITTSFSAGNGRLWQQNLIQERKSSITQSKLMIF